VRIQNTTGTSKKAIVCGACDGVAVRNDCGMNGRQRVKRKVTVTWQALVLVHSETIG
jgi:hypothetical protein